MEFHETLKQWRLKRKLRQQDMADKLNIKRNTYSGYETGSRSPSIDIIRKIADILAVDINTLFGYQEERDPLIAELRYLAKLLDLNEIGLIIEAKQKGLSFVGILEDLRVLAKKYK